MTAGMLELSRKEPCDGDALRRFVAYDWDKGQSGN
jgi:hypothetical protein